MCFRVAWAHVAPILVKSRDSSLTYWPPRAPAGAPSPPWITHAPLSRQAEQAGDSHRGPQYTQRCGQERFVLYKWALACRAKAKSKVFAGDLSPHYWQRGQVCVAGGLSCALWGVVGTPPPPHPPALALTTTNVSRHHQVSPRDTAPGRKPS